MTYLHIVWYCPIISIFWGMKSTNLCASSKPWSLKRGVTRDGWKRWYSHPKYNGNPEIGLWKQWLLPPLQSNSHKTNFIPCWFIWIHTSARLPTHHRLFASKAVWLPARPAWGRWAENSWKGYQPRELTYPTRKGKTSFKSAFLGRYVGSLEGKYFSSCWILYSDTVVICIWNISHEWHLNLCHKSTFQPVSQSSHNDTAVLKADLHFAKTFRGGTAGATWWNTIILIW